MLKPEIERALHTGYSIQQHLYHLAQRHGLPTILEVFEDMTHTQSELSGDNQALKTAWLDLHKSLGEALELSQLVENLNGTWE